jgi:type II secretory ATPase GspE/PulE/Tfp pilus assembly ATPase PilB-like protein
LGVGYVDMRKVHIPKEVLSYFSKDEVIKNKAIPLKTATGTLFVGMVNTEKVNKEFLDGLTKDYKFRDIQPILISEPSYLDWLTNYTNIRKMTPREENEEKIDISKVKAISSFEQLEKELKSAQIQDLLKFILSAGFAAKASDIHIEPQSEKARIRFRLDGVLHEVAALTTKTYSYILSQVELFSNLKLNAKFPQNGRFTIRINNKDLGVRIETVPSLHGDDIVLRLFNIEAALLNIGQLGMAEYHFPLLQDALMRPHGMILVSGPTGSGKTSTIYAILNELNSKEVKIITLEDPVEYELPGITQSQINEKELFSDRLKAVLREDPDIIMVGEIRDNATAETALQAALTGHLLISSIHANDAITSITRLIEMVGDSDLITTSTNLMIAQRLVRKICPHCKAQYKPTPFEERELKKVLAEMPETIRPKGTLKFFRGNGCDKCFDVGFLGRTGIFEILKLNNTTKKLIAGDVPIVELQEAAKKDGMITMAEDGVIKAINGVTTLQEVFKTVRE